MASMTAPDVTIIVTTYERAHWLEVSLLSILASAADARQIGISTRLLVVDNGSPTDATRAVAERLGVEYIRMPEHLGRRTPSYGRVVGLATVDSPYQAFFDDDDVMLPRWIRVHVEALRSGYDVCSTSFWETDDDLLVSRKVVPIPTTLGNLMAGRFSINDQSMIRRSVLEGITWEPELDNVMVLPVWLDLTLRGCSFHRLEEATFLRRVHGGSVTRNLDPTDAAVRLQVLERYRPRVIEQFGSIPEPTPTPPPAPPRAVRPSRPRWRRTASAMRRRLGL
jgi:glycosyltransferase involved in cell wall biosynthesis